MSFGIYAVGRDRRNRFLSWAISNCVIFHHIHCQYLSHPETALLQFSIFVIKKFSLHRKYFSTRNNGYEYKEGRCVTDVDVTDRWRERLNTLQRVPHEGGDKPTNVCKELDAAHDGGTRIRQASICTLGPLTPRFKHVSIYLFPFLAFLPTSY